MKLYLINLLCWLFTMHFQSYAQQNTINFQGILTDEKGKKVKDEKYDLAFRLYNKAEQGKVLWEEEHKDIRVNNGLFHVKIGAVNDLEILTFDKTYYLGISVDGGNELAPRTPLSSVAYAQRARLIDEHAIHAGDGIEIKEDTDGALKISIGKIEVQTTNTFVGDGTPENPLNIAEQGISLSKLDVVTATPGQSIVYDGTSAIWKTFEEFKLPYKSSVNDEDTALILIQNGAGTAAYFESDSGTSLQTKGDVVVQGRMKANEFVRASPKEKKISFLGKSCLSNGSVGYCEIPVYISEDAYIEEIGYDLKYFYFTGVLPDNTEVNTIDYWEFEFIAWNQNNNEKRILAESHLDCCNESYKDLSIHIQKQSIDYKVQPNTILYVTFLFQLNSDYYAYRGRDWEARLEAITITYIEPSEL